MRAIRLPIGPAFAIVLLAVVPLLLSWAGSPYLGRLAQVQDASR